MSVEIALLGYCQANGSDVGKLREICGVIELLTLTQRRRGFDRTLRCERLARQTRTTFLGFSLRMAAQYKEQEETRRNSQHRKRAGRPQPYRNLFHIQFRVRRSPNRCLSGILAAKRFISCMTSL